MYLMNPNNDNVLETTAYKSLRNLQLCPNSFQENKFVTLFWGRLKNFKICCFFFFLKRRTMVGVSSCLVRQNKE